MATIDTSPPKTIELVESNQTQINVENKSNASNGTSSDGGSGSWETTQILIIFLIIVFLVLTAFLLVYYCYIRGMKSRSMRKMSNKSVSGSITEDKGSNIFANPTGHLAVDQSTRQSPGNTSLPSEPNSPSSNDPPAGNSVATSQSSNENGASKRGNLSAAKNSSEPVEIAAQSKRSRVAPAATNATSDQLVEAPQNRKLKSKSNSKDRSSNIAGTLAGLRDVLKDTSSQK